MSSLDPVLFGSWWAKFKWILQNTNISFQIELNTNHCLAEAYLLTELGTTHDSEATIHAEYPFEDCNSGNVYSISISIAQ